MSAPSIGVVGSGDIAAALRGIGFHIITAEGEDRAAVTAIAEALRAGQSFPIVFADPAEKPLATWAKATATKVPRFIVVETEHGAGALADTDHRLELPATFNDLLGKIGYQSTPLEVGSKHIQYDGTLGDAPAQRTPVAPAALPQPLALPTPAPEPVAVQEPAPVAASTPEPAPAPQPTPQSDPTPAPAPATEAPAPTIPSPVAETEDDFLGLNEEPAATPAQPPQPAPTPEPTPQVSEAIFAGVTEHRPQPAPAPAQDDDFLSFLNQPSAPAAVPAPVPAPAPSSQAAPQPEPSPAPQYAAPAPQHTAPAPQTVTTEAAVQPADSVPGGYLQSGTAHDAEDAYLRSRAADIGEQPAARRVASSRLGNLIIVGAGKGGAGKTTTSVLLAQVASQMGVKTILVDANRGQPDIRKFLRLHGDDLPTAYTAYEQGRPDVALITPERANQVRQQARLDPIDFGIVLGPPADRSDQRYASARVYADIVDYARASADLVIVDTQILEAPGARTDLWSQMMIPAMKGDAWFVGIADESATGIPNLANRLEELRREDDCTHARTLVLASIYYGFDDEDAKYFRDRFSDLGTLVGHTAFDDDVHMNMRMGGIMADSPAVRPAIDNILLRVTGREDLFAAAPEQPAKRGLFGFGKKKQKG